MKPEEITERAALVPRGRSAIDVHPQRDEIVEAMTAYAVTPVTKRMQGREFAAWIKTEWNLELSPEAILAFMERNVYGRVILTPAWISRSLAKGEYDINTVTKALELAKEAKRLAMETAKVTDYDKEGNAFEREITPTEKANLIKTAIAAEQHAAAELERFGVLPGKKVTIEKTEVKTDLRSGMSRMGGGPIIDVDVKRTETTTSG